MLRARNGVEAPIHSINQIDVRNARRSVQGSRSRGVTGCRVTREIVFAQVGFGFHDATGDDAIGGVAFKHGTEQLARDELGIAIIEV
jgi:hypothetical protein